MKTSFLIAILLCGLVAPAFGELTPQDLDKIRLIIQEEVGSEVKPLRAAIAEMKADIAILKVEIAVLKQDVADLKTEVVAMKNQVASVTANTASLNGRIVGIEKLITWLLALLVVAIGIPQVITAWRSRKDRQQERRIEQLAQKIEVLEQQRTVNP